MPFMDGLKRYLVTNSDMPEVGKGPQGQPGQKPSGLTPTFEPTKRKTFNQNVTGILDMANRQNPYYDTGETMDAGNPVGDRPVGFTEHVQNLRQQMQKNKPALQEERYI